MTRRPLGGPWSDDSLWRRHLRFWGPRVRPDVDDELAFHLEMRVRDLVARGVPEPTAVEEARREFGDLGAIRQQCITIDERRLRRGRRQEVFGFMLLDVKFALRALRKSPLFTLMAVVCVALGVGVTTTIFTAVHGILIRPLPYRDADRLVAVYARIPAKNATGINVAWPDYLSWRDENKTFAQIGLWTWQTSTFSGTGDAERVDGAAVTPNLFPLLGVQPLLGRFFTEQEATPGQDRVVIISYALWKRRFAADEHIIGRSVTVYAIPYTVVGVMPPRFNFPERGDAWTPYVPDETALGRGNRFLAGAIGRLKPGVTLAAAQADLNAISARLQREYPRDNFGWDAEAISLRDDLVSDLRRPLQVFLGAVGMVLLIACANVANLMLARGAARQREIAVRVALGAGRGRVVRQVMVESLIIAVVGGAIGAAASRFGVQLFRLAFPNNVPFYISLDLNGVVAVFVVALTALTGVLFGIVPAMKATRVDLQASLKEGGRGEVGDGRQRSRLRNTLVVAEVALSLILLIGATLLVKSYRSLTATDLGFDRPGILAARVSLPAIQYGDVNRRRAYWEQLYARLAALPGVEAVGSANGIPFSGWNVQSDFSIEGRPARAQGEELGVHYQNISPDYFRAIGVPILRGRGFGAADRDTSAHVVIINEMLARREFPGQDPLGKRIRQGGADSRDPWVTIIGVARSFRHFRLPQPMMSAIYFPQLAWPSYSQTLAIRTTLRDPASLGSSVREVLRQLDPNVPAYQMQTFAEVVTRSLWRQRLQGTTIGVFAALAFLLAVVGMYGVIAYGVAQRLRELGVRIALGASRRQLLSLVVGQGARLAAAGVVFGILGALALTRVLRNLLYGVTPTDLFTFVTVPLVLAAVAVLASWLPAGRATRVDPVVVMRAE